jgi:hypothetical protein
MRRFSSLQLSSGERIHGRFRKLDAGFRYRSFGISILPTQWPSEIGAFANIIFSARGGSSPV